MNGPDKHHMILDDLESGLMICNGCGAIGKRFGGRPPGECPNPWLTELQLHKRLEIMEAHNSRLIELLSEVRVSSATGKYGTFARIPRGWFDRKESEILQLLELGGLE